MLLPISRSTGLRHSSWATRPPSSTTAPSPSPRAPLVFESSSRFTFSLLVKVLLLVLGALPTVPRPAAASRRPRARGARSRPRQRTVGNCRVGHRGALPGSLKAAAAEWWPTPVRTARVGGSAL